MKKTAIVYGESKTGMQRKAVELISKIIFDYTESYPICIKSGEDTEMLSGYIVIYIGTPENNEYIKKNSDHRPSHPEEYYIKVSGDEVIICGSDDFGVLYGCADFYNKYILKNEYIEDGSRFWENPFKKPLADAKLGSYPAVSERGIWTWGHVIYDYRGFIDNMVMLKLNRLTIWNDVVPFNASDIISYAHAAGIKVIWGYSWLWDTDFSSFDIKKVCSDAVQNILETYEKSYLPLGADGIYFQSFTEVDREYMGDVLIADAVTSFVNTASSALLEKYPELELQFGLHATSVSEKLSYIKNVDKRVRIVWENCGAFPFDYLPTRVDDFDETVNFAERVAELRGSNDRFGLVLKGMTKLDWSRFEHMNGSVCIGVSNKEIRRKRSAKESNRWRYLCAEWLTKARYLTDIVRSVSEKKEGDLLISSLIEDGMFEENIMFPAAFFAETLWDPTADADELVTEISLRRYVKFA